MPKFDQLRHPWFNPTFVWHNDIEAASTHIINRHSEEPDHLAKVSTVLTTGPDHFGIKTPTLITDWPEETDIQDVLKSIMLPGTPSFWRNRSVTIKHRHNPTAKPHEPPDAWQVPLLMKSLVWLYSIETITEQSLKEYYTDFLTIHPFFDGNSRAANCIIASLSLHKNINQGQILTANP